MTVALMWEARAPEDRGPELVAWVRAQNLTPAPERRETFAHPADFVRVITWWNAPYDADLPELPEPEGDLVMARSSGGASWRHSDRNPVT